MPRGSESKALANPNVIKVKNFFLPCGRHISSRNVRFAIKMKDLHCEHCHICHEVTFLPNSVDKLCVSAYVQQNNQGYATINK